MTPESQPHFATAAALGFSRADWAALRLAVAKYRAVSKAQAREFDERAAEQGWLEAAEFADDCQIRTLRLRPWECPPCFAGPDDEEARTLLARMRKARISVWHPDPLQALADHAAARRRAGAKDTAAERPHAG
jgi:hypothetical protein